ASRPPIDARHPRRAYLKWSTDSGIAEEGDESLGEFIGRFFWNEMAAFEALAADVGGPSLPHFRNSRATIRSAARAPQREHRRLDLPPGGAIGFIEFAITGDAGAVVLAGGVDHFRAAERLAIRGEGLVGESAWQTAPALQ